tara:strand:- start:735 stop:1055 length:321 start_codon:yes stop_codon:yes gene_type:complete
MMDKEIITHEFVVYDPDSGKIKDRIFAYCKATDHLPDIHQTEIVVLKHVDGKLNNNLYFPKGTAICLADSYVDPKIPQNLKLRSGTEEDFEFFMKNGHHKTEGSSI